MTVDMPHRKSETNPEINDGKDRSARRGSFLKYTGAIAATAALTTVFVKGFGGEEEKKAPTALRPPATTASPFSSPSPTFSAESSAPSPTSEFTIPFQEGELSQAELQALTKSPISADKLRESLDMDAQQKLIAEYPAVYEFLMGEGRASLQRIGPEEIRKVQLRMKELFTPELFNALKATPNPTDDIVFMDQNQSIEEMVGFANNIMNTALSSYYLPYRGDIYGNRIIETAYLNLEDSANDKAFVEGLAISNATGGLNTKPRNVRLLKTFMTNEGATSFAAYHEIHDETEKVHIKSVRWYIIVRIPRGVYNPNVNAGAGDIFLPVIARKMPLKNTTM